MTRVWSLLAGVALPLFEGEGGGAGGGGAAAAAAAAAAGQGGGSGAWTPPQGMPTEFVGKDAGETLGKLWAGYGDLDKRATGLRTQVAQMPKAPEKPDGYTWKPSEKLAPYFGADNKSVEFMRNAAHKAGIPDAAFGQLIEGVYTPMIEQGLIPPPFNPKSEVEAFGKATGLDQSGVSAALNETLAFAKGLTGQLKGIPEDRKNGVAAALLALTDTADGNLLIRSLQSRLAEAGIRISGQGTDSNAPLTRQELQKMSSDPRIDPKNRGHADPAKRYDEGLRKRFDDGYAALGRG